MGVMGAGGVSNGIYPTDAAKQVEYILNDSRSRFLFVENDEQLDKYLEVRERCPAHPQGDRLRCRRAVELSATRRCCRSMRSWRSAATTTPPIPSQWTKLIGSSKADELALLVYTSGTTGPPKGAMLSPPQRPFPDQQCRLLSSRSSMAENSWRSCRSAMSRSAPSPYSCRCVRAPSPISPRASRRCPTTCARSPQRCSSRCRASGSASIPALPSA